MSFLKSIPFETGSVWAIMSRYMDQTTPLFALTQIVMRTGECAFDAQQRELIAAFTSGHNKCAYCYGTHKSTAEAFGVDAKLLESLLVDIDGADIDDRLKPVMHYVRKLTLTPSRLVQSDVDNVFKAGWDENDFHFIVMICALFNFFNRMIDGYGVENTPDYRVNHGVELAEGGYAL